MRELTLMCVMGVLSTSEGCSWGAHGERMGTWSNGPTLKYRFVSYATQTRGNVKCLSLSNDFESCPPLRAATVATFRVYCYPVDVAEGCH